MGLNQNNKKEFLQDNKENFDDLVKVFFKLKVEII
ncbi:hypothetical protein cje34_06103 [Campylobacter jejuni subsp. jejuni 87459]|nr:hypothetical protein cco4_02397 [Campylobacter coli 7--1]EIB66372.1 hypothetical protein cje25_04096 [Campylobacter jejuni subsp. jejuni 1997-14]EIB73465.1 hypothetical protein cje34_06103 [Campylobacter jejuni subsp. jejuni 87459]